MLKLISVETRPDYCLFLVFTDEPEALISIKDIIWGPMFEPLKDPAYFDLAFIDQFGAINWPNGADIAPEEILRRVNSQLKT